MSVPGAFRNFTVVGRLGAWEAGPIFLGCDDKTGRKVAIKCLELDRTSGDPELLPRFLRESMVYRQLEHPNITRFVTSGVQDECHFLVLDHHEGTPLLARIESSMGTLPLEWCVRVARQVAAGLEHAHSKGVIHRNISPRTILITPDQVALITDFGVAATGDQLVRTGAGTRLGDHRYCSPEQNAGKGVTEASDLYALGLVLWHMLTGAPPLKGTFDEVIKVQASSAIPPPSSRRARVSAAVDGVCRRLLQAKPAARFGSAAEVVRALDGLELFSADRPV